MYNNYYDSEIFVPYTVIHTRPIANSLPIEPTCIT